MKIKLVDAQLAIVYILSACILIEWAIQLIAPFNALRLVSELNGLMVLSDPKLQSSHFIFRSLALFVDHGFSFTTFIQLVHPWINMSSFLVIGLIMIAIFHPSELYQRVQRSLLWLFMIYIILILIISASIAFAFFASSPSQVLLMVNRAGALGVFGGIGLCGLTLYIISSAIGSVVRQNLSKSV
jgi:hypothetical protein